MAIGSGAASGTPCGPGEEGDHSAVNDRAFPQRAAVLGVVSVGAYVAALSWAMQHWPYDYWGGFLVAPALLLITWPILVRIGRAEDDLWVPKVLLLALIVRFAGSVARYQSIFAVYGGSGDASVYDHNARRLAPLYWAGHFNASVGWPHFIGAGFIIVVTAIIYMLIGPTLVGGFFVYAWFSFIGLVLAYRAFRIALPHGDHRRYLVLLFFLPSLLFWPASIGKTAGCPWPSGSLSMAPRECCPIAAAASLPWPSVSQRHSLCVPMSPRSASPAWQPAISSVQPRRRTSLTPIVRVGGLVVILALTVFVAHRAASFLGVRERLGVRGHSGDRRPELADRPAETPASNPPRPPTRRTSSRPS